MKSKSVPTSKSLPIRVGITFGDPAGIGPEIIVKAINKLKDLAYFVVIGDKWVLDKIPNSKFQIINYKFIDLNNVRHKNFAFGKIKAAYGQASLEYIDYALKLIKNKQIDCLVTCPISKESIKLAGFSFPGHTEYLAKQFKVKDFAMMLLNEKLRFVLITRHIPLSQVSLALNKNEIFKTIILTHNSLKELFLIKNPRLIVCGLNPHASDNGIIGTEENTIIKPVLNYLKGKNIKIEGPFASDVAITKAMAENYDCIIAFYHDQALIPLKLLDSSSGVNLTLGLPFVRTSPLHGTAFDIAGKNLASADSLVCAIKLAIRCALNQRRV